MFQDDAETINFLCFRILLHQRHRTGDFGAPGTRFFCGLRLQFVLGHLVTQSLCFFDIFVEIQSARSLHRYVSC